MKKRLLALALAAVMLFSLGMVAFATDSSAADASTADSSTAAGDDSGALEIYIVRHGETLFNTKAWCRAGATLP